MEKLMVGSEELKWGPEPYPGSRMKIYPMIAGPAFFSVLIALDPEAVLEEHEEPFNEITIVCGGETLIEGKRFPRARISSRPPETITGPSPRRRVANCS